MKVPNKDSCGVSTIRKSDKQFGVLTSTHFITPNKLNQIQFKVITNTLKLERDPEGNRSLSQLKTPLHYPRALGDEATSGSPHSAAFLPRWCGQHPLLVKSMNLPPGYKHCRSNVCYPKNTTQRLWLSFVASPSPPHSWNIARPNPTVKAKERTPILYCIMPPHW